jgi:hypothetical protein
MKKLIAVLALFIGFTANANMISVLVDADALTLGETVEVTVMADITQDVDSFSFQLDFDTSLFSYDFASFYSDLEFFADFGLIQGPEDYGFSLALVNYFTVVPIGEYIAARFTLTAIAKGVSSFEIADVVAGLYDFNEDDVLPVQFGVEQRNASVGVPAPATLGMFAVAVFGLISLRRKA